MQASSFTEAYGVTATLSSNYGASDWDPFDGFGAQYGYYHDPSQLYLCGERFYDPSQGRWLTRDPIGQSGGIDLYAYCQGNPIMGADPSGTVAVVKYLGPNAPQSPPVNILGLIQVGADATEGITTLIKALGGLSSAETGLVGATVEAGTELYGFESDGKSHGGLNDFGLELGADAAALDPALNNPALADPISTVISDPKGGTYMLIDPTTGQVMRTGRSINLARRASEHRRDFVLGQYTFQVDRKSDSYAALRGREQIIHDLYNPSLNKINPISGKNPNRGCYLKAGSGL